MWMSGGGVAEEGLRFVRSMDDAKMLAVHLE